jgi:hypothetical protein
LAEAALAVDGATPSHLDDGAHPLILGRELLLRLSQYGVFWLDGGPCEASAKDLPWNALGDAASKTAPLGVCRNGAVNDLIPLAEAIAAHLKARRESIAIA